MREKGEKREKGNRTVSRHEKKKKKWESIQWTVSAGTAATISRKGMKWENGGREGVGEEDGTMQMTANESK